MFYYHALLVGLQDLTMDTTMKVGLEELETMIRGSLDAVDVKFFEELALKPTDEKVDELVKERQFRYAEMGEILDESMFNDDDIRQLVLYEYGMQSKNEFVRQWYTTNLNINNILTAQICRKHGFDIQKAVVGHNELAEQLRTSKRKDFGLGDLNDEYLEVLKLAEIEDLYERERRIDALRWEWLEQPHRLDPCMREDVYAYYLRAKLLYRWNILNVEEGEKVFRSLISDMKRDIKF